MMFFEGCDVHLYNGQNLDYLSRWLYPDDPYLPNLRPVHRFASLADFVAQRRPRSIYLHRTYALGDILMLIPLAAALHRSLGLQAPIQIGVSRRFLVDLRSAFAESKAVQLVGALGKMDRGCDVHMDLDSVLEKDHHGGPASDMHRIDLYAQYMGLKLAPHREAA